MRLWQFAFLMSALFCNTAWILDDASSWFPLVPGLIWAAAGFLAIRRDHS